MVEKLRLKIILVALFILFIILPIIFLTLTMKKKGKSGVPSENKTQMIPFPTATPKQKKIQSITILDSQTRTLDKSINYKIAAKILNWLETMKDDRGAYQLGLICKTDSKKCKPPVIDNRVGLAAIWGRFKYYEKTGKKEDLTILDKDIFTYAEKIDPIQNDFWNCRMMYDLWRSNLFSSQQKTRIKKICDKGSHDLEALIKIEEKIKVGNDSEVDFNIIMKGQAVKVEGFLDKDRFTEYSSAASDYITRYLWNNNSVDFKIAKHFLSYSSQIYSVKRSEADFFKEEEWLLAQAALDIYKATKEKKYLDFALHIPQSKKNDACQTPLSCVTKANFYHELFNLTKNSSFRDQSQGALQKIIDFGYDTKRSYGFLIDNGAVHSFNMESVIYSTRENGLIAAILSFL